MIGTRGAAYATERATSANSASIGAISGEWNAWLTRSGRAAPPAARHCSAHSAAASAAPETTTAFGPLTAATTSRSAYPARLSRTAASAAGTDSMTPPSGTAAISRPRAATSRAASGSVSTPATCAADSSPIECPSSASGRTPSAASCRWSATWSAKRAGWVTSVRSSRAASAEPGSVHISVRSGRSRCGSSAAQTSSSAAAKTGSSAASSRPVPSRWLPCPVKSTGDPGTAAGDAPARRAQCGDQLGGVPPDRDGPVRQPGPAGQRRRHPRRLGQRAGGVRDEPVQLRVQRRPAARGDHPRDRTRRDARRRDRRSRRLLQQHVRVGPAHPERGHPGPPRPVAARPRHRLGQQRERAGRPVRLRRRLVDVQGRRQQLVPQRLHHLHHPADPGGGLGVADVGLQRAEPQRAVGRPVRAVGGEDRLHLDRVAEHGRGAVALDRVHIGRSQPGRRQRGPDHLLLGRPAGGAQAVRRAVGVDRGAAHHGEHPVAQLPGPGQPLHQQQPGALGEAGALGGGRVRPAAAVRGQAALPAELGEHRRRGQHGDPAGHRGRALPGPDGGAGQVQRDQRGGAGGVDGQRRARAARRRTRAGRRPRCRRCRWRTQPPSRSGSAAARVPK